MGEVTKIIQVFARHTECQAWDKCRGSALEGPCVAGQVVVDITQQARIATIKIFNRLFGQTPASLPFHFFEFFQRRDLGAQSAGSGGIKRFQILAVEDHNVQAVKMKESVNQPEGCVLERFGRAES
jgi:hypothetical protein